MYKVGLRTVTARPYSVRRIIHFTYLWCAARVCDCCPRRQLLTAYKEAPLGKHAVDVQRLCESSQPINWQQVSAYL